MNVHTIHPNLGMDEMVDFRLQNSKHYTEQMRFINGLDWTILLCILPIKHNVAKWAILQGFVETSPYVSTFSFFKQVIGFDFVEFMNSNQEYFKEKIQHVLEQLMRAEFSC